MFTRIFNYKGNTFFEYDFKGKPFRYIEVRSVPKELNEARWRLTLENDKFYRQIVRNWSECVTLSRYFSPKEVRDLHYHGVTPEGYSLHHVHPRALGGHTLELSNMVLISRDLHDKLHDFMRDFIIAKCLPLTQLTAPIPDGQKIFMAVPILPPVVNTHDISFAEEPMGFTKDLQLAKKIIFKYLKKYPRSFSRPLFVNGVVAKNPNNKIVPSWPPARIHPTQAHQLHSTRPMAVRTASDHWSFNEWAASVRNKSQNFRA
ncbi:MAG: HNH endonuclease [Alphaproteobacteria bacterium]|nr:HNH endonuclease [Alphaproteobacteria bacterium]